MATGSGISTAAQQCVPTGFGLVGVGVGVGVGLRWVGFGLGWVELGCVGLVIGTNVHQCTFPARVFSNVFR